MAAVSKLEITNLFADDTKIKITIDNLNPSVINSESAIENIKTKVKAFNDAKGGELANKMKSKNGFNWVGITKVNIVTTERTYIF